MSRRILVVSAVVAIVVTTSVAILAATARVGPVYGFIPDPLLRARSNHADARAYDESLQRLLEAEVALMERHENLVKAQQTLAAWDAEVDRLWQSERAGSFSPNAYEARSAKVALARTLEFRSAFRKTVELAERAVKVATIVVEARVDRTTAARLRWEEAAPADTPSPGSLVEPATLLVTFKNGTSAAQVRDVLDRHRLKVRSEISRISLYVVTSLDEPQATIEAEAIRLHALIVRLEREPPLVESAKQNTLLRGNLLPRPNSPVPRNWLDPNNVLTLDKHVQAWNFLQEMKAVDVGILDQGFVKDPDIPPVDVLCGATLPDPHGSLMAGVIGAQFDNGKGTDGGAPPVTLVKCAPPPVVCDPKLPANLCDKAAAFAGFIQGLDTLLAKGVMIVNASLGYNWGESFNPAASTAAMDLVKKQGGDVRKLMAARNTDAILIASAGNDSKRGARDAVWSSPFNWAALGGGTQSENVVVAEATYSDGTRLNDSNTNASIKALGINILARVDSSRTEHFGDGTSGAAALVTSTVAMLRSLDSSLTPAQITSCLGIGTGSTPQLNAFEAIKQCVPNHATILGDLDKDKDVDEDDFLAFRKVFRSARDGRLSPEEARFGRADLNGDTHIDARDLQVMATARGLTQAEATELARRLNES